MLYSSEYQIMKYFSAMLCQNIVPQVKMKYKYYKYKYKNFLYIYYFPLIVSDKFLNVKLNVFIITG